MNLTLTMAANRDEYLTRARKFGHLLKVAAAAVCYGPPPGIYEEAQAMGLSDLEIVANYLAESDEHDCMRRFPSCAEVNAIEAWAADMESNK